MAQLLVTVPPGYGPGHTIHVQSGVTAGLDVIIPPGVKAGETFTVVPPAAAGGAVVVAAGGERPASGKRPVTGRVGVIAMCIFWYCVYLSASCCIVLPLLSTVIPGLGSAAIYYAVFYLFFFVVCRLLAPHTFYFLDLSHTPITFVLDDTTLTSYKPPTGLCGCCPLPFPGCFRVADQAPIASIKAVEVYQQTVQWRVIEMRGGVHGPSAEAHAVVDRQSVSAAQSLDQIQNLPGLCMLLWQPCQFFTVQCCDDAGPGFTEAFLGAKVLVTPARGPAVEKTIRLTPALRTRYCIGDAFNKRDEVRARLVALGVVNIPRPLQQA